MREQYAHTHTQTEQRGEHKEKTNYILAMILQSTHHQFNHNAISFEHRWMAERMNLSMLSIKEITFFHPVFVANAKFEKQIWMKKDRHAFHHHFNTCEVQQHYTRTLDVHSIWCYRVSKSNMEKSKRVCIQYAIAYLLQVFSFFCSLFPTATPLAFFGTSYLIQLSKVVRRCNDIFETQNRFTQYTEWLEKNTGNSKQIQIAIRNR